MNFTELATQRYSMRSYSSKEVEQVKIDAILEMVKLAPTACNLQPQRVKVINAKEDLAIVDACTGCRYQAPVVFLICYDSKECWVRNFDQAKSGEVDSSIVATHMMLKAEELGLGSLWVMHFDAEKARELFNLPTNIIPMTMLMVGYPGLLAKPAKPHSVTKKIEEMLI
jgi:Nitroreductase